MKIHEVPKLPRGEELPSYVFESVDEVCTTLLNQYDNLINEARVQVTKDSEYSLQNLIKKKDGLIYQAILSVFERTFVVCKKEIDQQNILRNRRMLNRAKKPEEQDSFGRVKGEKVEVRFKFLSKKLLNGLGFGADFNIATLVDAILQDLGLSEGESTIKRMISSQDRKTKQYPGIEKLLLSLIEQHRKTSKLENVLTLKNANTFPPVFVRDEGGVAKEYYVKNDDADGYSVKVYELDEPFHMEAETYLQDICIGDDTMEYKKALVNGTMKFFSVSRSFDKPRTISAHLKNNGLRKPKEDSQYFRQSTNPDISKLKIRRHPELTISVFITGKRVRFDQLKLFKDETLDLQNEFTKVFLDQILPDLFFEFSKLGYEVDPNLGGDLTKTMEGLSGDNVYILGKGVTNFSDLKEGDKVLYSNTVSPSKHITKEKLKLLCDLGVSLDLENIKDRQDLLDSIEIVTGDLHVRNIEEIHLPNLKKANKLKFGNVQRVFMPSLEVLMQDMTPIFNNVTSYLDVRKLKVYPSDLKSLILQDGRFDSLERIDGSLSLGSCKESGKVKPWFFPSLKKVNGSILASTPNTAYNMPELEEASSLDIGSNSMLSDHFPKLKRLNYLSVKSARSLYLPRLESLSSGFMFYATVTTVPSTPYTIDLPALINCREVLFATDTSQGLGFMFDFSSLDLNKVFPSLFPNVRFPAKSMYIFKDPDQSRSLMLGLLEYPNEKFLPPKERLFGSKGEYLVKTGKYWGEFVENG
jgi:hypothetical protein